MHFDIPRSRGAITLPLLPLLLGLLLIGCTGSYQSPSPTPTSTPSLSPTPTPAPSPTPTPTPAAGHLYASSINNGIVEILVFPLPITANSAPSMVLSPAASSLIAVDVNGNLAALDSQCHVTIYNAPLSNPLTPSATFMNGTECTPNSPLGLAFNASGGLFATIGGFTGGGSQINVFTPPFSSSSTVAQVINTTSQANRLTFDANGNLYAAALSGTPCAFIPNVLFVIPPPYTSPPTTTVGDCGDFALFSIAISNTQLFVSQDDGAIAVGNLPLGPGGFLLPISPGTAATLAVDQAGNLYAAYGGQIHVYAAPVVSSSVPLVNSTMNISILAFGP